MSTDKPSLFDTSESSGQRRRRWTASEKVRIVEETFEPGMTVSLVARRHGVAPNQLFTWRRLVVEQRSPQFGVALQDRNEKS